MHPGRENTKPSDRQLRHLVYVLERAVDLMPEGQDSLVIVVDYRSTTLRSNPSISVAAKVLHILQDHYPERLGRAIVVHLPFILQFFYKGISPFLDPVTRDKTSGPSSDDDERSNMEPRTPANGLATCDGDIKIQSPGGTNNGDSLEMESTGAKFGTETFSKHGSDSLAVGTTGESVAVSGK
ncbi:hypothetical protein FRC17_003940 [Serendipita sp. 399]|nr:hypothetical protein FRC17_003940 [Serendipita sp. 399]